MVAITELWMDNDENKDGKLTCAEFTKCMNDYMKAQDKKYGGETTLPDELHEENYNLILQVFGKNDANGISMENWFHYLAVANQVAPENSSAQ